MSDDGKPNPVIDALSNAVASVRADDDQLALARAYESLAPKAIYAGHRIMAAHGLSRSRSACGCLLRA